MSGEAGRRIMADRRAAPDRVDQVVANWFPRFLANDLDYLDVRRTLDGVASWADWADAWTAAADRYVRIGDRAAEDGHDLTAAEHLRRAALTLHFAQFVLLDDVERRAAIHARQCDLYARAAPRLRPPAVRVEIPTRVGAVPGYLRHPPCDPSAGLVVLVPGLESTKEQFSTFEPYLLDRGLSTLSVEGPGQGETRYRRVFRDDDYGLALAGVSRFVTDRVPGARPVALLGTSFGGYLALRHAREFGDLAAVVDIAGPYDLGWFRRMQPVVQEGFRHVLGVDSDDEAESLLIPMTLDGHLPRGVPALVVHGARDPIIPVRHAHRIAGELGSDVTLRVEPEGNHSCNNLHTVIRPFVADWIRDRIREDRR
jgi:alpha-beta hydrolase superfamily lysophospholipase